MNTIYDISENDKSIKVKPFKFLVALPEYYNIKATRHKTKQAALKKWKSWKSMGYNGIVVTDEYNTNYDSNGFDLY